ncbi:hypothetical protein QFC19_002992 [Naganishia cerealis]|uniref:Uncharacterized protein n=1 Tax=Naganishia cerealis TaxID=610337 RepID=A0ACC2W643_9TREE|nr:hypothetical protein QFC19_002992 [Naganishia cerealis]
MTRGRAPNLALPLTKALAQQRDYRARKAANIARLESENELLRTENAKLRQDLASYQEGRPVRNRQEDEDTSIPENQDSQNSAGYAELKLSYEQLEAEVQRKEQVLHSLRDKEKEAFARVEALLQQSLQVVGGAMVSQDPQSHNHDLAGTTVKEEPLKNVSAVYAMPPVIGPHLANAQTNGSIIHSTSAPASRYYTQLSVDTPDSQTLRSTVTSVSNRASFSPDPESYRSRKRVRSASSLAASVGPKHSVSSQPYPQHASQTYGQHSASPYLAPEYPVQPAMYPAAQPIFAAPPSIGDPADD